MIPSAYSAEKDIEFNMFIDEIKGKLNGVRNAAFSVTLIGRGDVCVSGIKNVLSISTEEIKMRLAGGSVAVSGEELVIVEIGGGDALIKGRIGGVSFE